jgi:PAS domain S-box-containing protein
MTTKIEAVQVGHLSKEELIDFINAFPALLWRIDLVKNKIEYLNHYRIKGLGANSGLLLQNSEFRREMVFQEDIYLLEDFMQAVRNGETAATLFRVKTKEGAVQWVKVTGVATPDKPQYYIGFMLDVTNTVAIVQSIMENDTEMQAMIELSDAPALLIDPQSKTIAAHNAAARDIFLFKANEFNGLKFSELLHEGARQHIQRIFEELIFEKKWEGQMVFRRKDRSMFGGDVAMHRLLLKGRRLFRVSIYNIHAEKADEAIYQDDNFDDGRLQKIDQIESRKLQKKMASIRDIVLALQILLENQIDSHHFDAIIYSDIYAKKNRVVVYTAGKAFSTLPQGEIFAYEGTIAENINRFKLDHLIMENTFASIKAIDWALFIPHGIRSYFAKPFYERRVMRSVLILCSEQENYFSSTHLDQYAVYYQPFLKALKNWRSAQKTRRAKRIP